MADEPKLEMCSPREDEQFGLMIAWLKKTGQRAFTRKGQTLIIQKKPVSPGSTRSGRR